MRNMRKTYFYYYDMEDKNDWLFQSMGDLSECLAKSPTEINYTFTQLPEECEADIRRVLDTTPDSIYVCEASIIECFVKRQGQASSLLVLCDKESPLAEMAVKASPKALWGIATYSLSLAYEFHDQYSIWHEMLHLIGADDCYDLNKNDRGPNCNCPNCIMQYEATKANVGDWPFLCDANIQRIQRRIQQWKK